MFPPEFELFEAVITDSDIIDAENNEKVDFPVHIFFPFGTELPDFFRGDMFILKN